MILKERVIELHTCLKEGGIWGRGRMTEKKVGQGFLKVN